MGRKGAASDIRPDWQDIKGGIENLEVAQTRFLEAAHAAVGVD
jgi:hypothetical protein